MGLSDLVLLWVRMDRSVLLLLLLAAVCGVFAKRKFCPRERNGDKCRAKDNTFKCGVFFYDLLGKGGYQYLTELPQALHKTGEKHWKEILGDDITFETFNTSIICDEARGKLTTLGVTECSPRLSGNLLTVVTGMFWSARLTRLSETISVAKSGVG